MLQEQKYSNEILCCTLCTLEVISKKINNYSEEMHVFSKYMRFDFRNKRLDMIINQGFLQIYSFCKSYQMFIDKYNGYYFPENLDYHLICKFINEFKIRNYQTEINDRFNRLLKLFQNVLDVEECETDLKEWRNEIAQNKNKFGAKELTELMPRAIDSIQDSAMRVENAKIYAVLNFPENNKEKELEIKEEVPNKYPQFNDGIHEILSINNLGTEEKTHKSENINFFQQNEERNVNINEIPKNERELKNDKKRFLIQEEADDIDVKEHYVMVEHPQGRKYAREKKENKKKEISLCGFLKNICNIF
jgi:hypothetical protein